MKINNNNFTKVIANSSKSSYGNLGNSQIKRPQREKKLKAYYDDFEASPLTKSRNFKAGYEGKYSYSSNLENSAGLTSESMKKCFKIIQLLKKHKYAYPFLEPVDPHALNIPDYFDIIKEPIDLGTIENKLKLGKYITQNQFFADVKKIWNNSFTYNGKGSQKNNNSGTDIYFMTVEMSNYFDKIYREFEGDGISPFNSEKSSNINELQRKVDKLTREIKELHGKGSKSSNFNNKNRNYLEKPMSLQEKKQLGQCIRKLPPEYLRVVWEIVSQGTKINAEGEEQQELEFDIDTLPPKVCRELEKYVKSKLQTINSKSKKKRKPEGISYNDTNFQVENPMQWVQPVMQPLQSHQPAELNYPIDPILAKAQSLPINNNIPGNINNDSFTTNNILANYGNMNISMNIAGNINSNDNLKNMENESKSSESSFITDSEDSMGDKQN